MKALRKKHSASLTGLTVRNGIVVASFETLNQLLFIDAHAEKLLGTASVASPRGLGIDSSGKLYVLSGQDLVPPGVNKDPMRCQVPDEQSFRQVWCV